ncbi:MAG TPA: ComEC/Rec2 family competence protein [Lacipirellulaceae bacterium]|jgi:competence protein ComEC|nr:ComEC/Rec2 family competence protein [Lacipirellulaceae bacterium]
MACDRIAINGNPEHAYSARSGKSLRGNRSPYQPLVVALLAVAAGMLADRYLQPQFLDAGFAALGGSAWFVIWWLSAAACLATWCFAWRHRRDRAASWILLIAAALAGAAWHHRCWFNFSVDEVARYATDDPRPACIDATACESAERVAAPPRSPFRAIPAGEHSRLLVSITGIRDGKTWRPASGICQVSVQGHALGVHPGDELRIFGKLSRPSSPLNPGEFNFAEHARADGVLTHLRAAVPECIVQKSAGSVWSPHYVIDDLRTRAKQLVRSFVGPTRAGLAAAILLGAREGLPYEETQPYMETGTIHVLVVSGMNVAILAVGLLAMMQLGWLPRRVGLSVIIAIIVAYTVLAEAQPPVMRAAVLGTIGCAAIWIGRRGVAFNSLFGAALMVLLINPNDLFRTGPQLSFLAVAVCIWVGSTNWFRRLGYREPLELLVRSARPWHERLILNVKDWATALLFTSAAVWLVTAPLVMFAFHIVSPIAIPMSFAVWPLITIAMWSGFFMVIVGWLIPVIGTTCGSVCNWSLAWLEGLVKWAESLRFGHFWMPGPAWWWVVVFYLGVVIAMIWGRRLAPRRWQLATVAVWVLVGLIPPMARSWTRDGLTCSVVAVGHGECILLEGPHGETMLCDAGSMGSPEYATQTIASYLWSRGIMRIDGVVLSHADTDHYDALPGLLERFRIGAVYVSPVMFESTGGSGSRAVAALRESIERAGVPIREIWSGNRLKFGPDASLSVMHPPKRGVVGDDNANSVTVGVEYDGRRVLLPGDLESPGLDDVMAEEPYHCDVLLAPHHGSRRSEPAKFAAWCTPDWVVMTSAANDEIQTASDAYKQLGASILPTPRTGTVRFDLHLARPMEVVTWRGGSVTSAATVAALGN